MAIKMWSPKGNLDSGDTVITLLSGHSFIIPHNPTGVEVPTRFQKEAIAKGCIPVGMAPEQDEEVNTFDRHGHIRTQMRKMMQGDDPAYFTTDGKPNLGVLTKLCGFQVNWLERDKLWNEVAEDPDGAKDGEL